MISAFDIWRYTFAHGNFIIQRIEEKKYGRSVSLYPPSTIEPVILIGVLFTTISVFSSDHMTLLKRRILKKRMKKVASG
jgi:hypothetical protein